MTRKTGSLAGKFQLKDALLDVSRMTSVAWLVHVRREGLVRRLEAGIGDSSAGFSG